MTLLAIIAMSLALWLGNAYWVAAVVAAYVVALLWRVEERLMQIENGLIRIMAAMRGWR